MEINLFSAENKSEDGNILNKIMMGMMFGLALGWVLLRIRRQEPASEARSSFSSSDNEIEITDAVLKHEEVDDEQVSATVKEKSEKQKPPAKDSLEKIKGIGPVFAKRLNRAGIQTFADLAALEPDKIRSIVQAKDWQRVEPDEWIAEANVLAGN